MGPDEYRRYAIECLRLAGESQSQYSRLLLTDMAQSWLALAQQAERNLATDLVYETPTPAASKDKIDPMRGDATSSQLIAASRAAKALVNLKTKEIDQLAVSGIPKN